MPIVKFDDGQITKWLEPGTTVRIQIGATIYEYWLISEMGRIGAPERRNPKLTHIKTREDGKIALFDGLASSNVPPQPIRKGARWLSDNGPMIFDGVSWQKFTVTRGYIDEDGDHVLVPQED